MTTTFVFVGGYLGAGKTSLMLAAARRLQQNRVPAAILTNDLGTGLVDTQLARAGGFAASEVTGGCFCCNFTDLAREAEKLAALGPQVIFAEPVGSCVDLARTVIRPLQRYLADRFRVAPFTVLVDPGRARETMDAHSSYLFHQQIAEADLVAFSRADLYQEFPELPGVECRRISAVTGQGLGEWLEEVLEGGRPAGAHPLQVDYPVYAEAEASLGWLNWQGELRLRRGLTPAAVVGPLLAELGRSLAESGAVIAHLKLFDQASTGHLKASLVRNQDEPALEGRLDAPPAARHRLVLNLRASADPELLRAVVEKAAAGLPGKFTVKHLECFRPAVRQAG